VSEDGSAFEFPCDIPVKVFGHNLESFRRAVLEIARTHFPELEAPRVRERLSRADRFLSITLTVWVENRDQIDALYRELTAHEDILMVL